LQKGRLVIPRRWLTIARELLCLPTSPLCEHAVADWLGRFAAERSLALRSDVHGNLTLRYRRGASCGRPWTFCAHMDHPGFMAERMLRSGVLLAAWRGGVPPELFAGARVRFFSEGRWVRGRVLCAGRRHATGKPRTARIQVQRPVTPGSVGMWDFPDPHVRGKLLFARGHDDVASVAAIACVLDEVCRTGRNAHFHAFFTRAEESGFLGAIGACKTGSLPKRCRVLALETSRALANARLGDGVVIRVGDKTSIFDPGVTSMVCAAAADLARRSRRFRFQRKLMDGGTCESAVYSAYGYEAGGLCLPLGNYHNVDWDRMRLGPEYIHLDDFEAMVRLLLHLAAGAPPGKPRPELPWERLFETYGPDLHAHALTDPADKAPRPARASRR